MLGERTYGDEVDTGFGDGAQSFEGDIARRFKLCTSGIDADSFAQTLKIEIVEQNPFGISLQCLLKLG